MTACLYHKKTPAKGYNECPGCEIEMLRDENAQLKATIAAIHFRITAGPKITDATVKAITEECEMVVPTLAQLTPNACGEPGLTEPGKD